jgi:hypothetical protein
MKGRCCFFVHCPLHFIFTLEFCVVRKWFICLLTTYVNIVIMELKIARVLIIIMMRSEKTDNDEFFEAHNNNNWVLENYTACEISEMSWISWICFSPSTFPYLSKNCFCKLPKNSTSHVCSPNFEIFQIPIITFYASCYFAHIFQTFRTHFKSL